MNYSGEILWRMNQASSAQAKVRFPVSRYDEARALGRAAAKEFAALNGWRLTNRNRCFQANTLARGGTHDTDFDQYQHRGGVYTELFDHAMHFRWASRPYKAAAIVGQPYGVDNEHLKMAYAEAQKMGLELHVPMNLTASAPPRAFTTTKHVTRKIFSK